MNQPPPLHQQALADLDRARPRQALRAWRKLLLADAAAVEAHLAAAAATLAHDPLATLRRQALTLVAALQASEPGESEVVALGALLRNWGQLCRAEAPGRALQHWERAWGCGSDPALAQPLAALYRRLGFLEGATLMHPQAQAMGALEPWPASPCPAQACAPCGLAAPPADPPLQVWEVPGGRCWLQLSLIHI
jgi:hypothetical protein